MATIEFDVSGMTCGHCETSVREEVSEVAGVDGIEVSAQTGKLSVTGADTIDPAAIIAAVDEAGYSATTSAPALTVIGDESTNEGGCCGGDSCNS